MKKTWMSKGVWILALALSLTLILATFAILFQGKQGVLGRVADVVVNPIHGAVSFVSQNVSHIYRQANEFEQLLLENQALKETMGKMEAQVREGILAVEENQRLYDLLGFWNKHQNLTFAPALVIREGSSNWSRTLQLNQGSEAGFQANDCVVNGQGQLLGILSQVGKETATMLLISDPAFQLPGRGLLSGERGLLSGDFHLMKEEKLRFSYVSRETILSKGEEVLTFSGEGLFPSGLVVGVVEALEHDESGLSINAVLAPSASLDDLHQVFVITDF